MITIEKLLQKIIYPNVYNAYQYFKKNDNSLKYYKNLKHIVRTGNLLQRISVFKTHPRLDSMDVNHAICMIHNNNNNYKTSSIDFVHMKSKYRTWIGNKIVG